jgi:hypothetical protein
MDNAGQETRLIIQQEKQVKNKIKKGFEKLRFDKYENFKKNSFQDNTDYGDKIFMIEYEKCFVESEKIGEKTVMKLSTINDKKTSTKFKIIKVKEFTYHIKNMVNGEYLRTNDKGEVYYEDLSEKDENLFLWKLMYINRKNCLFGSIGMNILLIKETGGYLKYNQILKISKKDPNYKNYFSLKVFTEVYTEDFHFDKFFNNKSTSDITIQLDDTQVYLNRMILSQIYIFRDLFKMKESIDSEGYKNDRIMELIKIKELSDQTYKIEFTNNLIDKGVFLKSIEILYNLNKIPKLETFVPRERAQLIWLYRLYRIKELEEYFTELSFLKNNVEFILEFLSGYIEILNHVEQNIYIQDDNIKNISFDEMSKIEDYSKKANEVYSINTTIDNDLIVELLTYSRLEYPVNPISVKKIDSYNTMYLRLFKDFNNLVIISKDFKVFIVYDMILYNTSENFGKLIFDYDHFSKNYKDSIKNETLESFDKFVYLDKNDSNEVSVFVNWAYSQRFDIVDSGVLFKFQYLGLSNLNMFGFNQY